MKSPFFVSSFSSDNHAFSNLIKNNINVQLQDVTQKKQLKSIVGLLESLSTKTMVCENEYVDNGYLDDYLNYYVGCHENYPKTCSRIHFFGGVFDYDKFEEVISNREPSAKNELGEYLGFVVIKPIPMTFVGRTCLKNPIQTTTDSTNIITRKYSANLFGLKLEVESLAFQEQDQVVSACTSASIWCLLHALQVKKIKSPAQITLAATEHSKIINTFPNSGLNPVEIERALEYFDLRHHTVSPKDKTKQDFERLSKYIKTYIDSNIPMILGAECLERSASSGKYEEIGKHAVTVIGYELNADKELEKLIVHDDRQGPFSVLKFVPNSELGTEEARVMVLVNENLDHEGSSIEQHEHEEILVYTSLIIATDPRVRIGFNTISKTEKKLKVLVQGHIDEMFLANPAKDAEQVKVFTKARLLRNTVYKSYVKSCISINKSEILTGNFPKYVWVIDLYLNEDKICDFVFDSSCLPQGEAYMNSSYVSESSKLLLTSLAKNYYERELKDRGEYRFRDSDFILQVLKNIKSDNDSFFGYHSEKFGRARMPQRIKPTEIQNEQLNDPKNRLILYNSLDNEGVYGNNRFKKLLESQEWIDAPTEWESSVKVRKLIWVISGYGALFVGADSQETGHPTLTGAKPARIGGEFIEREDSVGKIIVNNFSGRYSTNYEPHKKIEYLNNAVIKIRDILSRYDYTFVLDERVNSE